MIITTIKEINDKLNEWMEPVKAWIDANHGNPLMWIAFFLIGLAVFFITYNALHKDR